jgi:lysophospholipase L1-like esterase
MTAGSSYRPAAMPRPSPALRALLAVLALMATDAVIVGAGWALAQTVVPAWKKGPLIDPVSPYAPENAYLLGAVALAVGFDLYLVGLAAWRRWLGPRRWAPWLVLAASVAITEASVRAYLSATMLTYFRPHPTLYWEVRPNLHGFVNHTGGDTILDTNADGMRGVTAPRQKAAGEYRILVLGDSSNFGHGVEGAKMWSAVLQDLLRQRLPNAHVGVLNGACPGWTTWEGLRFLEETGLAYQPDAVLAGFNNDPGPDYLGDRQRRSPPAVQVVHGVLFHLETYLLAREVVLATLRRFFPAPDAPYTARSAGSAPVYGKLAEEDAVRLVPRVPLPDFLDNLAALHRVCAAQGAHFAWIDMPFDRAQPDLVERYVDPSFRAEARALAAREGFPVIEVDSTWARDPAPGMHLQGHVFHPSPRGHRRLAEQVADELFTLGWLPTKP